MDGCTGFLDYTVSTVLMFLPIALTFKLKMLPMASNWCKVKFAAYKKDNSVLGLLKNRKSHFIILLIDLLFKLNFCVYNLFPCSAQIIIIIIIIIIIE